MKPRLESAALTDEDCVALVFIGEKRGHCGLLEAHGRYLEADRRDADLMYKLQLAFCLFEDFDQAEIWSACFRADILRGDWKRVEFVSGLDITNCA